VAEGRGPDGIPPYARVEDGRRRTPVPQSFQTRLTFGFIAVVALTLTLVAPVLVLRLDDFFRQQEETRLQQRAESTAAILVSTISSVIGDDQAVVWVDPNTGDTVLNPKVQALLEDGDLLQSTADQVALAKLVIRFGPAAMDTDGTIVPDPDPDLQFSADTTVGGERGQARDAAIEPATSAKGISNARQDWGIQATLSEPWTSRQTLLTAVNGLLLVMGAVAFLVAVLVAAFLAHRFTTPITRLTDASRRLAEGDLSSRVATDELSSGTLELRALSTQFNQMADRLEESVDIIRRDRDRSRDFLADVSHELRTPIAAMRTFVELLQGPAGVDPAARAEFLASSATQLDRLDWLAQNLLELSKLDSGLVLLELRPDDLRGTVESAVEQQQAAAERRGIRLAVSLPDRPLRVRHDSPRIGQVVTNLVGNALKFTERGGEVRITAQALADGGARLEVADTGVGIPAPELPRIFDRFYRGAADNEARSAGSGLGLAIVKSIVDMHHGTIVVESRVGHGSRFTVTLPRDPREVSGPEASHAAAGGTPKVDVSSPTAAPPVNPGPPSLTAASDQAEPTPTPNPEKSASHP
jgi:signal transduction histidine kinase